MSKMPKSFMGSGKGKPAPNMDPSNHVKRASDLGIGKGKASPGSVKSASMKGGKGC